MIKKLHIVALKFYEGHNKVCKDTTKYVTYKMYEYYECNHYYDRD